MQGSGLSYGFIYMLLILLPDWKSRKLGLDGSHRQSQFYTNPTGKSQIPPIIKGSRSAHYPTKGGFFLPCFLEITYSRTQELSVMRTTGHNTATCNTTFPGFYSSNSLSFGQCHRHTMMGVCSVGILGVLCQLLGL